MENKKFRAWDEGNKIMHYNFQWIQSGEEGNDWICFTSDNVKWPAVKEGLLLDNPYLTQQLKKMQLIGLKDGMEVYEGDILCYKFNHDESAREHIDKLEWYNYAYRLKRVWLLTEIKLLEIMGNIYENPELIKTNQL